MWIVVRIHPVDTRAPRLEFDKHPGTEEHRICYIRDTKQYACWTGEGLRTVHCSDLAIVCRGRRNIWTASRWAADGEVLPDIRAASSAGAVCLCD